MVEADNRESAREIESAANQAENVTPGARLSAVADALPGSESAGSATSTGTEWDADVRSWARAAHHQHTALDAASQGLTASDVRAAGGMGHPTRGPF